MPFDIFPICLLFAVALVKATRIRKHLPIYFALLFDLSFGILIWTLLPLPSITPWWGSFTFVMSQWPKLTKNKGESLAHGGPLGSGCAKAIEVICGIILWRVVNKEWPDIRFGPMPEWKIWVGIFLLSGGVNLVLYLWSHFTQSRGDHSGVNDMVEPSIGRALSWKEHLKILLLALVNSACEEVTSRFFWMAEFNKYLPASNIGNVCQSVVFGAWHYHGIPSGWTGVAMTFVYGLIMGFFFQYGDGLLLPVMAHALADYYIFASIVRQQDIASASKER